MVNLTKPITNCCYSFYLFQQVNLQANAEDGKSSDTPDRNFSSCEEDKICNLQQTWKFEAETRQAWENALKLMKAKEWLPLTRLVLVGQ